MLRKKTAELKSQDDTPLPEPAACLQSPRPLRERVDDVLAKYAELNDAADVLIEEYVDLFACPHIPRGAIRQCEVDARARGYSHEIALRVLRQRLGAA